MSEMIERVAIELAMIDGWHGLCVRPLENARKVWETRWEEKDLCFQDEDGKDCIFTGKETYRHRARAIISSMHEPTPLMLACGWAAINKGRVKPVNMGPGLALREAWPAMIDAALADAPQDDDSAGGVNAE